MALVLTLFILCFVITAHELGHFIAARLCKVPVSEMAIGIGPKVVGKYHKGCLFSIRLIPLGGFCKMDDEYLRHTKKRHQILVMSSGILFNLILAFLLFTIQLFAVGTTVPVVGEVRINSAAEQAGMQVGDKVTLINSKPIRVANDITNAMQNFKGDFLEVEVIRDGRALTLVAIPERTEQGYKLGIAMARKAGFLVKSYVDYEDMSFVEAVRDGYDSTAASIKSICSSLGGLLTGKTSLSDFGGPIGIASEVNNMYESTSKTPSPTQSANSQETTQPSLRLELLFVYITGIMAFLSVNLAVVNLVPLPMLDGGRLLIIAVEFLRGKKIHPDTETALMACSVLFLIALTLIVTIADIIKLF